MQILEMPVFTIKKGVTEKQMLEAHEKFNREFMKKQAGYVSHSLLKRGQQWYDIAVWATEVAKDKAFSDIYKSKAALEYIELIDSCDDADIPLFSVVKDYDA